MAVQTTVHQRNCMHTWPMKTMARRDTCASAEQTNETSKQQGTHLRLRLLMLMHAKARAPAACSMSASNNSSNRLFLFNQTLRRVSDWRVSDIQPFVALQNHQVDEFQGTLVALALSHTRMAEHR